MIQVLKKYTKHIVVILVITILIILTKNKQINVVSKAPQKVEAIKLHLTDHNVSTSYFGFIESENRIELKSENEGAVIAINKPEGNEVKAGEVIITLDAREYEQKMHESESFLKTKKIETDSVNQLVSKKLGSQALQSKAMADYEKAKAEYINAKNNWEGRFVKSPFDGIISKINVRKGMFISKFQSIGELSPTSSFKVRIYVSEKDILKIHHGDLSKITTRSSKELEGYVSYISHVADNETKSFPIDILIKNAKDEKILDGIVVKADIFYEKASVYFIPHSALSINSNEHLIIKTISQDNIVEERMIEVVNENKEGVYIKLLNPEQANSDLVVISLGNGFVAGGDLVEAKIMNP